MIVEGVGARVPGWGGVGRRDPWALLFASSLLGRPPCPWRPSRASGSTGPGIAAPGWELAVAVRGCCSNEKSEQLNRKIWIKKLEFNTHAPHLLKH